MGTTAKGEKKEEKKEEKREKKPAPGGGKREKKEKKQRGPHAGAKLPVPPAASVLSHADRAPKLARNSA
jgi:hypothetical protein